MNPLYEKTLLKGYRFRVELDGSDAVLAYASEVTGFEAEYDIAEYRSGDDSLFAVRKYPGLAKFGNVTVKQCLIKDTVEFYNLLQINGDSDFSNVEPHAGAYSDFKKDLTITMMDDNGQDTAVWLVKNAMPVKYTGPDLNASVSEISVESIEFCCDWIKRTQ